jgi:LDH2 family malate/lactate/ureidoglycolate dehydrogenase
MTSTYKGDVIGINATALSEILAATFQRAGQSVTEAKLISRALVDAEMCGVPTHGVLRVPGYLGGLCSKRFNPQAKIQTLHESPTSILLDADNALGYLPT